MACRSWIPTWPILAEALAPESPSANGSRQLSRTCPDPVFPLLPGCLKIGNGTNATKRQTPTLRKFREEGATRARGLLDGLGAKQNRKRNRKTCHSPTVASSSPARSFDRSWRGNYQKSFGIAGIGTAQSAPSERPTVLSSL